MIASHAAVSAHTTGESRTPTEASVTNAQIFYAVYITENSCVLFWVIPPCSVVFSLPAQNGSKNPGTLIWQQIKDYPTTSAGVKFIALKDKHSLGSAAIIYDSGTCLYLSLEQSFGLCASKESTPTLL